MLRCLFVCLVQVIRCGVSAKVLLKAMLISGSRLGCFTYGWLTLLEFMVQFMWIVVLSCTARMAFPDSILNAADIRMLTMSMPECQVWSIAACNFTSNKLTVHVTVNVLPGSNWSCCQAPAQSWANIQTGASGTHAHTHTNKQKHKHTHTLWHIRLAQALVLAAITCLGRPHLSWEFRAYFGWTSLDWVVITTRDVGDMMVVCATYLKYHRCHLSCLPFIWHFFHCDTHARAQKHTPGPGGDSPRRVTRAWDSCLFCGRTSLDMVTMCDVHVSIVVLAAGLALLLHCDLLASNLIICRAWPHGSCIFSWRNLVGRGGDLHLVMSVIWRSCAWKYRLSCFKCHLPGTLFSLCFTCSMHTPSVFRNLP